MKMENLGPGNSDILMIVFELSWKFLLLKSFSLLLGVALRYHDLTACDTLFLTPSLA